MKNISQTSQPTHFQLPPRNASATNIWLQINNIRQIQADYNSKAFEQCVHRLKESVPLLPVKQVERAACLGSTGSRNSCVMAGPSHGVAHRHSRLMNVNYREGEERAGGGSFSILKSHIDPALLLKFS